MTTPWCLAVTVVAVCATGCAGVEEAPAVERLRFAVIVAPDVGEAQGELSAEDALLEVVTQLSGEPDLAFCLIPGPLLASEDEDARLGLVGALGSLAAQPIVALAPDASEALVSSLGEEVAGHPGGVAYRGARAGSFRPVALKPSGKLPTKPKKAGVGEDAERLIAAQGGSEPEPATVWLVARHGEAVRLERSDDGPIVLELPSVARPPYLYGIVTVSGGTLTLELRSAMGTDVPAGPAPLAVKTPGPQ